MVNKFNEDLTGGLMISNYMYFITLAEELNITNASRRLFISHQCLSKYLKNLEKEYDVIFFERKPFFKLTTAGHAMLDTLRKIELSEQNLKSQLSNLKESKTGIIKFGITEGRYPILIPKLLKEFHSLYPNVELLIQNTTSVRLKEMTLNNQLDLYLAGVGNILSEDLKYEIIINENMYIVISDNLLEKYFSSSFPDCKHEFSEGADLTRFQDVPFILNKKNYNTRTILDKHLHEIGASLNCIIELTQLNIHHRLSAEDYAASISLSMYLPYIDQLNNSTLKSSYLNVFPIANLKSVNPLGVIYHKNKMFPEYTKHFIRLIHDLCNPYSTNL
jgi:DNA-binding transcriptional LysR family regulator